MKKNNLCTIYIVRHGETEANRKRILQGHSDFPLTEIGVREAKEFGKKFARVNFAAAFSSDLLRAKRTAELILLEKKIAVQTSKRLKERSFGRFEGRPFEEFGNKLRDLFDKYETLSEDKRFKFKFTKEGESDEELAIRMITFLREVAVAYAGKTVLVVSHGGVMRAFLKRLGFNFAGLNKFKGRMQIGNLGYVKLDSDGVDFFIKEIEGINASL